MNALASFAALEMPLREVLHPAIHVEPKDRHSASEDDRQDIVVATLRRSKAIRVYAVPNGGKRTQWAAAKAKREGMIAGEPDLGISWSDHPTVRIEMKDGRGDPTQQQIEALNWYHLRGHPVAICRTLDGVLAFLGTLGAPVGVRVSV